MYSYKCSLSASVLDIGNLKYIVYVMMFNKIRKQVTNGIPFNVYVQGVKRRVGVERLGNN